MQLQQACQTSHEAPVSPQFSLDEAQNKISFLSQSKYNEKQLYTIHGDEEQNAPL